MGLRSRWQRLGLLESWEMGNVPKGLGSPVPQPTTPLNRGKTNTRGNLFVESLYNWFDSMDGAMTQFACSRRSASNARNAGRESA